MIPFLCPTLPVDDCVIPVFISTVQWFLFCVPPYQSMIALFLSSFLLSNDSVFVSHLTSWWLRYSGGGGSLFIFMSTLMTFNHSWILFILPVHWAKLAICARCWLVLYALSTVKALQHCVCVCHCHRYPIFGQSLPGQQVGAWNGLHAMGVSVNCKSYLRSRWKSAAFQPAAPWSSVLFFCVLAATCVNTVRTLKGWDYLYCWSARPLQNSSRFTSTLFNFSFYEASAGILSAQFTQTEAGGSEWLCSRLYIWDSITMFFYSLHQKQTWGWFYSAASLLKSDVMVSSCNTSRIQRYDFVCLFVWTLTAPLNSGEKKNQSHITALRQWQPVLIIEFAVHAACLQLPTSICPYVGRISDVCGLFFWWVWKLYFSNFLLETLLLQLPVLLSSREMHRRKCWKSCLLSAEETEMDGWKTDLTNLQVCKWLLWLSMNCVGLHCLECKSFKCIYISMKIIKLQIDV